jgi:SMI1/KNR4 family protein SUKH-1
MTVKIVHPNPHGALSESQLIAFENRFGLQLPADYRSFLLDYNGGRPVPSFFWIKDKKDGTSVDRFYGVYDQVIPTSIETYIGADRPGIPLSMIPIGDDGTGNFICLGLGYGNFGDVFFLDHDLHPLGAPDSPKGITRLAASFTEFLSMLQPSPSR